MPVNSNWEPPWFWLAYRGICKALVEESTSSRGIRHCGKSLVKPGFEQLSPLHRHATERPRPATPLPGRFGSKQPALNMFHPCGFAPLRWFPPLGGYGFIASRCRSWGSSCFRTLGTGSLHEAGTMLCFHSSGVAKAIPNDANHTPRRTPLSKSRTVSPQPLPPCRFDDFEALLLCRVRTVNCCCQQRAACPSMGFVPLQGPLPTCRAIRYGSKW